MKTVVCPRIAGIRRARIAAALWGGFLLLVTSWPHPPDVGAVGLPIDKLTHFALYAVEGFLLFRAIRWPGQAVPSVARVLAIIGTLALLGALDEAHQEWIPGRHMDAADLAADVAGAAVGATAAGLGSRTVGRGGRFATGGRELLNQSPDRGDSGI